MEPSKSNVNYCRKKINGQLTAISGELSLIKWALMEKRKYFNGDL